MMLTALVIFPSPFRFVGVSFLSLSQAPGTYQSFSDSQSSAPSGQAQPPTRWSVGSHSLLHGTKLTLSVLQSYWMSKGLLGLNGMVGCFGMVRPLFLPLLSSFIPIRARANPSCADGTRARLKRRRTRDDRDF